MPDSSSVPYRAPFRAGVKAYQTMRESAGAATLEVPSIDGVTLADYDKGSKTLTWGCNTLVLGEQIAIICGRN